jgi:signal transduction histidine kinase/CheY-like chemotaxis protein
MSSRTETRWPVIVAGVFCIYAVLLLWNAFQSEERLRVTADARVSAESKRRAAALGEIAAEQRSSAQELAGMHELNNYLVNEALGMSPLYGLDASLGVVEQRLREWMSRANTTDGKSYTRIAWLDASGRALVDVGPETSTPIGPAGAAGAPSLSLDLARRAIVSSAPVIFKGEPSGTVVALRDVDEFLSALIQDAGQASYRETLLTSDGREIVGRGGPPAFTPALAAELSRLVPGRPTPVGTLPGAAGAEALDDAHAVVTPVPGLAAVLVTTFSREEIYGHLSSPVFLYSLSAFPAVLLLAAVWMSRLQGRARELTLDAARSQAHRHVLQDRNEALSEEIRRREAIEAELQRHRDHLEELVARRTAELTRLFHALPDMYFRIARDGSILEHRAGREADLFVVPEKLLGCRMRDIVPADAARKLDRALDDVARGAEQCIAEYEVVLAGGRQFYEARVLPLDGDQLLMVVRNVTDRRELEETREANRREAERLARVKSEFLANMSHEIRTPLNAVLGLAQIGSREGAGRGAPRHFQGIVEAGRHLLSIVDDILDFSKLEAGKLSVERRAFSLSAAVDSVVGLVAGRTAAKGLALPVTLAPDLPDWVEGDVLRVKQVLVNLLSNAVKFTDRGQVSLMVRAEAEWVSFEVADTGIGMDEPLLARLFQPFEQADGSTTRRFGGTGLGLAISRNLAALMGGEILVVSRPGQGSVFTLRVPLPVTAAAVAPIVPVATAGPRLSGLHVLAAEDNEVNRLILQAQLENEGCGVVFARNGEEALAAIADAQSRAFDAVLMDVQMPVMDGIEATRQLRRLAPELPVIGLTAHALPEERDRCLAAGMADHVTKPIDMDRLVACLLHHVVRAKWNRRSAFSEL